MQRILLTLIIAQLCACSSQVYLTIDTDPPGATVYEGQKLWGESPVTLAYQPSTEFTNGGCMGTSPIKVEWDSGAEARVNTLTLCAAKKANQEYTFVYPEGLSSEQRRAGGQGGSRPVTSDGKLMYKVSDAEGREVAYCASDVDGSRVRTTCS